MEIINKIIKKESSTQEKLTYLLPAGITILYLIDIILILVLGKGLFRRLISEFLNISKIVFIFSSVYAAYKNYDYFKKANSAFLAFTYICFFWIYVSLYDIRFWTFGFFIFFITLIFQIYLFLNTYLNFKFDFNYLTNFISSNFSKKISFLNQNKASTVKIKKLSMIDL